LKWFRVNMLFGKMSRKEEKSVSFQIFLPKLIKTFPTPTANVGSRKRDMFICTWF